MSSPPQPALNTIGSPEERDLYSLLAAKFSRVLLYCHPSTFFSPVDMENEDKESCFLGEITLAILTKNKYGPLLFCVIPRSGQFAESVRRILARQKVTVVQGDLPADYVQVKRACEEFIKNPPTPIKIERGRITEGENWIRIRIDKKLQERGNFLRALGVEPEEYEILHEFPLRRVISLKPWPGGPAPIKATSQAIEAHNKKRKYLTTSRFDVLLTSGFPDAFPFMAAEYQGPDHEKSNNKSRDKLKAELCRDAGLPLLIATFNDIPRGVNNLVPNLHEHSRMFQECFEFAFINILGLRNAERQVSIWDAAHHEEVMKLAKERIKIAQSKSSVPLTPDQRLDIFFDTNDDMNAEGSVLFSMEEQIALEEGTESLFRLEIEKKGGLLSAITYNVNEARGGIAAGADLQTKNSGSTRISLHSPRVYLDGQSVAGHSMKSISKSFVRNWILRAAYKAVESQTAKVIAIKRD